MATIKDNELLRQFEITTEKGLLTLEYAIQERKIFLTKLCAPEQESDETIQQFVSKVLEHVEERKFKVVPTHPKMVSFFRKNKKYHSLLPPGIKI